MITTTTAARGRALVASTALLLGALVAFAPSGVRADDDVAPAPAPAPETGPRAAKHHQLAAEYSAGRGGVSLVVMVGGEVVFEDYPNGGAPERAHVLASGTKSFSGAIAVAAAGDGILDLDEKVADTITEWQDDPRKATITIRQLLSLRSGLKTWVGKTPTYAEAITQPVETEPGTAFGYGSVAYQVFGEVIRRKLAEHEEDPLAYLKRRILDPIGCEPASWRRGADGNPNLPSGATFTAREWAVFGELIRRRGTWGEDQQILDPKLLAECFRGSEQNERYGLTWWLGAPNEKGRDVVPADMVMAAGAGKQRLYVIPSLELVAVRQAAKTPRAAKGEKGEKATGPKWNDAQFIARLVAGTDVNGKKLEPNDGTAEPGAGGVEAPAAVAPEIAARAARVMKRCDKDGDGGISVDEAPESLKKAFDRIDADDSGLIDDAELQAVLARRARRGAGGGRKKRVEGDEGG